MRLKWLLLGAFLLTISAGPPIYAQSGITGNLTAQTTDCTVTNACLILTVPHDAGGATIKLSGTFTATVQFEATADPLTVLPSAANWVAMNATPSNSTTAATSSTGAGAWQVNVAGYQRIRIRVSSFGSGTVAGAINLSTASARGGGGGGGGSGTITACTTTGGVAYQNGTNNTVTCDSGFTRTVGTPNVDVNNSAVSAADGLLTVRGVAPGSSAALIHTESNDQVPWHILMNIPTVAGSGGGFFVNNLGDLVLAQPDLNAKFIAAQGAEVGHAAESWIIASDGMGSPDFSSDLDFVPEIVSNLHNVGTDTFPWNSVETFHYKTGTNCSSSASPAVCTSTFNNGQVSSISVGATAGSVVIAAAATSVVVNTTAVTANSQILVQFDSSLGTKLGVTCNAAVDLPAVTARTAATSFTITASASPITNPACYSYWVVN